MKWPAWRGKRDLFKQVMHADEELHQSDTPQPYVRHEPDKPSLLPKAGEELRQAEVPPTTSGPECSLPTQLLVDKLAEWGEQR